MVLTTLFLEVQTKTLEKKETLFQTSSLCFIKGSCPTPHTCHVTSLCLRMRHKATLAGDGDASSFVMSCVKLARRLKIKMADGSDECLEVKSLTAGGGKVT